MGRRFLAAVAILSFAVAIRAERRGAVDWIFLVDTSKSMRGVGGTENIFDDVKDSIRTFVRESSEGDSVSIFTFDSGARLQSSTEIRGTAREDLDTIVDGLQAEGNRTHLGLAIAKGLERAESSRASRPDPTRNRAVVLFTDGKEDIHGIPDPVPIRSNIERAGDTHIFFVSMGEHEPKLDAFAAATRHTTVLRAPTRAAIRTVAQQIRAKLPAPKPPAPPAITVSPQTIDFGEVILGQSSEERELTITTDKPVRVDVRLSTAPGISMAPLKNIALPARVTLRVDVAEDATPGAAKLTIHAGTAAATGSVSIVKPSPLIRAAQWLVAIALLAAIAFFVYARHRKNSRLEGEIEIVRPRLAPDAAFVGLPALRTSEVALSAIVPPDALAGSDARLFVRRRNGIKKVWISAQGGPLRINDVETPMSELYDADTIRIGDAQLRFNHVGHERTQEEL